MSMTMDEQRMVSDLKEKLQQQDALLQQLAAEPHPLAVVTAYRRGEHVCVVQGGEMKLLRWPDNNLSEAMKVGACVALGGSGQIMAVAQLPLSGSLATVVRYVVQPDGLRSGLLVEVECEGRKFAVMTDRANLEEGTLLVIDRSQTCVLRDLGRAKGYGGAQEAAITWDQVGGLEEAKQALREAIEWPIEQAKLYAAYGKRPPKGVLLWGPPGCGKTLLGKAAAGSLQKMHGKKADGGFLYVKAPEILASYVGESEAKIRAIFAQARAFKKKTGAPAVVFIDEADAILKRRGGHGGHRVSGMEDTIVPMFLSEMDGFEDSGCFVILATNRPDTLDPAVVREGRIDRKIRISRPTQEQARGIFEIHAKGRMVEKSLRKTFAEACAAELYKADRHVFAIVGSDGNVNHMTLGDLCSGSMIPALLDRASARAMLRDMKAEPGATKVSGIGAADIAEACDELQAEHAGTDHSDDIRTFIEGCVGKRPIDPNVAQA